MKNCVGKSYMTDMETYCKTFAHSLLLRTIAINSSCMIYTAK